LIAPEINSRSGDSRSNSGGHRNTKEVVRHLHIKELRDWLLTNNGRFLEVQLSHRHHFRKLEKGAPSHG